MTSSKEKEVIKTIGIRLDTTAGQDGELKQLFDSFRKGINWSIVEIEKRYKQFETIYQELPVAERVEGTCSECNKPKKLRYSFKDLSFSQRNKKLCTSCATRMYSEYTVRKEIYGFKERVVTSDLKDVVTVPVKTHYTMMFSQAYAIWKSYNSWQNKRIREREAIEDEIAAIKDPKKQALLKAAEQIEENAKTIHNRNGGITWKLAKAQAVKSIFLIFKNEAQQKEIRSLHSKLMDLKRLSVKINLPQLQECKTVMLNQSFVSWSDGKLFMTLFEKGHKEIEYFGKEYLSQYVKSMEKDTAYCNLTRKNGNYYLMYPLAIPVNLPDDIKNRDSFVFITSPGKVAVMGYDGDGVLNSVKWFGTGELVFAKRNFKEKRSEISRSRSDTEKRRKIRRRKKKVHRRGSMEQRFVSTYNHQLTRKLVDYIMSTSKHPNVLIWDVGNGITQNFGRSLNYRKNLWVAVQQQNYLRHKLMQVSIPVIEVEYNKCNNLTCSSCGAIQKNGNKPAKIITQLIKDIRTFKCEKCKYEVNILINQTNNIMGVVS